MANPELGKPQIGELRQSLETMRDELQSSLHHAEDAAKPVTLDQQSVGRVSRIDAIQQQQIALAGREQARQTLKRVELALRRIDAGEYGYCRDCDEPIAFARLEVQPFAALCVDCHAANETS